MSFMESFETTYSQLVNLKYPDYSQKVNAN